MRKTLLITLLSVCYLQVLCATGYVKPPVNFHQYTLTEERSSAVLPEKYDSRDLGIVLPARDQLINGTCWAFSNADALQSLFYKKGLACGYLSPQAFATCFTGFLRQPITEGGNQQMAGSLIARLEGIVTEKGLPYDYTQTSCQTYDKKDTPAYSLGWIYLPEDNQAEIKKAIMEYGSVTCSFYYHISYFQHENNLYEYTGKEEPNHGVSLIGWDDQKGAWLAKNTWGERAYDNGFMWISYKDSQVSKTCVAYTDMTDTQTIDHVYHYNTVGMVSSFGTAETNTYIRAIVQHHIPSKQQLQYIGTYCISPNTKVFYSVWTDTEDLFQSEEIVLPYTGFYKYSLPSPLEVEGDVYISVTYSSTENSFVIPIEANYKDYCSVALTPNAQWVTFEGSEDFQEFGNDNYPYNLCIYAYTKDLTTTSVNESDATYTLWDGQQLHTSVWDEAKEILLYSIDGQKVCSLNKGDTGLPPVLPGIYLLQIINQDGRIYTEKIKR